MSSAFGMAKTKFGLFRPFLAFGFWSWPDENACFDFCAQRHPKLMCHTFHLTFFTGFELLGLNFGLIFDLI